MTIREVLANAGLIVTPTHISQMRGNKSCGYIQMRPSSFLKLTTSSAAEENRIIAEAKTVAFYNQKAKEGGNSIPPFLWVVVRTNDPSDPIGLVVGHEGRHRAAACLKEGINKLSVFLVARVNGGNNYRISDNPDASGRDYWNTLRPINKDDFPDQFVGQFVRIKVAVDMNSWKSI